MKKYEEYKDSSIEWLGEIPSHWELSKLKYLTIPISDSKILASCGEDSGDFDFFTSSQSLSKKIDVAIYENEGIILGTGGSASIHYHGGKFSTSTDCLVLNKLSQNINLRYIYYFLLSQRDAINDIGFEGVGIKHLQKYFLLNLNIFVPPQEEQQQIVSYLDYKTLKIDELISKKEELVETLKNARQKLISETVTKGLNKDVKMKDSGVEWIGEIPEHWEVKKIKYLLSNEKYSLKPGPFGSDLTAIDLVESGIKVYTQRNAIEKNHLIGTDFVSKKKFNQLKNFKVKPGDFLITTRGTIGKVYLLPTNSDIGILHPCLIKFNTNKALLNCDIVSHIFNESDLIFNQIRYMNNATIIDVIYSDTLKNIVIPIAPMDEQIKMISYLNNKISIIDELISKTEEQIEILKKAKQSLITEVVTGKIDVRDWTK